MQQSSSLQIRPVAIPGANVSILCDVSQKCARPVVPKAHRRTVFNTLHGLAHPGIKASVKLLSSRFVWPGINRDVANWARTCLACQRSKVHLHTRSPLGEFPAVDERFQHVHVDLVGPLHPSRGATYLLTCIDRFTRWPEAIPLPDASSETVARAFMEHWVARFGCPTRVTTDRGTSFSASFHALLATLGCIHTRTTAYHPQANGMVERMHRPLKAALKAHDRSSWQDALPLVLLGMRTTIKENTCTTNAEMVYGTTVRLPGEMVSPLAHTNCAPADYAERLSQFMRTLRPIPIRKQQTAVHVSNELNCCSHVFLRVDSVRSPLQAPYTGPHKVVQRGTKSFVILMKGKAETVSIDRVKPAFIDAAVEASASDLSPQNAAAQRRSIGESNQLSPPVTKTRNVRLPVRFADYVTTLEYVSSQPTDMVNKKSPRRSKVFG